VPLYQNIHNLCFTLLLIAFYTVTVNKQDSFNKMETAEWWLDILALGFFFDGVVKMLRLFGSCGPSDTEAVLPLSDFGIYTMYDLEEFS
jgi:hypothetical protein